MDYQRMGYLPDAMVNFLARLGWSHGDQEIFSREELIRYFSLEHVGKAASIFDTEKLSWLNGHYLRETPAEKLAPLFQEFLARTGCRSHDPERLRKIVRTLQPRAATLADMAEQARFYFQAPPSYEEKAAAKFLTAAIKPILQTISDRLARLPVWTEAEINALFHEVQQESGRKMKEIAQAIRLALTGRSASPGLFEIMDILGPAEVQQRLQAAMAACR
jgi:glutamyl-tRNA synthetase